MVVMLHNLPSRFSASLTFAINSVNYFNGHISSSTHSLLCSLQTYDNPLSCQLLFYTSYMHIGQHNCALAMEGVPYT